MTKEESLIVEGCKSEVRSAQKALYVTYRDVLLSICLRYMRDQDEASDVLHEVFLKVFDKIIQFKGEGSFEGWLKRLTTNHCLTILKKEKRYEETSLDHAPELPEEEYESQYSFEQLKTALNALPKDFMVVFSLYAIDGLSHKEIAAQMGIPEETSRTRCYRAKNLIKKHLKKISHE